MNEFCLQVHPQYHQPPSPYHEQLTVLISIYLPYPNCFFSMDHNVILADNFFVFKVSRPVTVRYALKCLALCTSVDEKARQATFESKGKPIKYKTYS